MNEMLVQFNTFLDGTYFGNTLRDWLIAATIIIFSTTIARAFYWLILKTFRQLTAKTDTHIDDLLVEVVEKPLLILLILFGIWFALTWLVLPEKFDRFIIDAVIFSITLLVAWLVVRIIDVLIEEYLKPLAEQSESSLDDQILPVIQKGSKVIIWAMALIICIKNAGYDVAALLAGLGIGGIALAMAAKDTIANIFGGITILTDRPFSINDRIKISGYEGTVIDIGVRSTRLRTLEGRIVTIPNLKFAESPVENVSWEPSRKVTLELGLTYGTTSADMEKAMKILRDIAAENANVEAAPTLYFSSFGTSSLNIQFAYHIAKQADISATQSAINFAILKSFSEAGLSFAYPTQTVYTISTGK